MATPTETKNESVIPTATLVFAGTNTIAGMKQGEFTVLERSMVVQFDSIEDIRKALDAGCAKFAWTWVREPSPTPADQE